MKRTLFLLAVLAPAAGLVGVLWDRGWAPFGNAPAIATRGSGAAAGERPASRQSLVSIAGGSGEHLFVRSSGRATIGGADVEYVRSFAYARSWSDHGGGDVRASGPVLVLNAEPRNEHDVARLLAVDTARGAEAAGTTLAAAFGSWTGIRSRDALIRGDADFAAITRVDFEGAVEAVFVDPEIPGDRLQLAAEALTGTLEGGKVATVATTSDFAITRPGRGDLVLAGRGAEVSFAERRARVLGSFRLDLLPGGLPGIGDLPIHVAADGPVAITLGRPASGAASRLSLAGSRVAIDGPATFTQGDLRASARSASIVFDAAGRLEALDLATDVRIVTAYGTVEGARLAVRPYDPVAFMRLEGSPVTARPGPAGSGAPVALGSDATLTTRGAVVVSAPDGASGERTITIGPGVAIAGSRGSLDAATVRIRVPTRPGNGRKFEIVLEDVRARDEEAEIVAQNVRVERTGEPASQDDVIVFPGSYDITWRPKPRPAARPESQADGAIARGGPARIRGRGGLTIRRPVFDWRPLTAVAERAFQADSIDPASGAVRATIEAASGTITLACEPGGGRLGASPSRRLEAFEAAGQVRVDVKDRAIARGDRLTYDGRVGHVFLLGRGPDDPARIERVTAGGVEWLSAGRIKFEADLGRMTATQSARAQVVIAALPWLGARPSGERVLTLVAAQRLVAMLDGARLRRGDLAVTEVLAEIAVVVTQPDRRLCGDFASFDVAHETGFARGVPLRYEVVRVADGARRDESLACPSLVLDGKRVLVDGPCEALLHAPPLLPGGLPPLGATPEARPPRPESRPHLPVALRSRGPVLLTEEFITGWGGTEMVQGQAGGPGVTAAGDTATLFLTADPTESRAAPDLGLLVLSGKARFDSPDLEAASDVMKLNRVTRHATLLNERPEKLTVILRRAVAGSEVHHGVARLDIDFADPRNPVVTAFDHDIELDPETRSAPR